MSGPPRLLSTTATAGFCPHARAGVHLRVAGPSYGASRRSACRRGASFSARRVLTPTAGAGTLPPHPRRRRTQTEAPAGPQLLRELSFELGASSLRVAVFSTPGKSVTLLLTAPPSLTQSPLLLHWGLRGRHGWTAPGHELWPAGTQAAGDTAVQTAFDDSGRLELRLPADAPPLVFVLKQTGPEKWFNAPGGGDFSLPITAGDAGGGSASADAVIARAIEAEATWSNFSLFNRLCLVLDMVPPKDAASGDTVGALFAWLRYSSLRLLPHYKNSNYQSKDCAHVQEAVASKFADLAACGADGDARAAARAALSLLPRGGGNGDDIRMGILNIMRAHGIREGHRPGIEDRFIEEWHQKLHTNTGPDDIAICESYLYFLQTGSVDEMYRVLWEQHGISRAHLESMDHPIRGPPLHMPHLIPAFQHYLHILRTIHGGAQLDSALGFASGHLGGDLAWTVGDILAHRHEWWVPGKIADARAAMAPLWRRPGASRDVILLDIALEKHFRQLVEATNKSALSKDDLIELTALTLRNAAVAGEWPELEAASAMWNAVRAAPDRWSPAWSATAAAASDFAARALAEVSSRLVAMVARPAADIGIAAGIPDVHVSNFAEEVVRGSSFAALAPLLRVADGHLRAAAGLGAWAVASNPVGGVAAGSVHCIALADVQGHSFEQPTVIVSPSLDGLEDIPAGVTAVVTGATVDVLAHVALRARAQGVLLAACLDADALASLTALAGRNVTATVTPTGDVLIAAATSPAPAKRTRARSSAATPPADDTAAATPPAPKATRKKAAVTVGAASTSAAWALPEGGFAVGLVGGKALSCASLRASLAAHGIAAPPSVALPYGTFERVLAAKENADVVGGRYAELTSALAVASRQTSGLPAAELAELRLLVETQLLAPTELVHQLVSCCLASGVAADEAPTWATSEAAFEPVWAAICGVWASKFADRAWLSRRAAGIADDALKMSVLLQPMLPARYAFVLHTTHPLTQDANTLLGEVVCGLGEALVGAHPGRALAFTATHSGNVASTQLLTLPSKLTAFHIGSSGGGLIARSDSNGEDLPGFAGAGLYDSVPVAPGPSADVARYEAEALVWDAVHRESTLKAVAQAGWAARDALGGQPLDCEGVVLHDGTVALVQARPQVV
jgi:alpha-glucan,water dikinase